VNVTQEPNSSIAVDSQTNATATATLAAAGVGFKWRVTAVSATYSGAAVATPTRCTLALNGQTIGRGVSTNDGWQQSFTAPLESADNGTVVLTLLTGGAGAVGDVMVAAVKVKTGG
jgi:hypothetical protein